jgi:hypothetical protein
MDAPSRRCATHGSDSATSFSIRVEIDGGYVGQVGARAVLALPCVSRKSSFFAKGQRPFGSLAPPTGSICQSCPTNRAGPESHSHPTDERELIRLD